MARIIVAPLFLFFALVILFISVYKASTLKYDFQYLPNISATKIIKGVDYNLPYPGNVHPNSILWPVKVMRDKALLLFKQDYLSKAEISLLLADKRLGSSIVMYRRGDYENGVVAAKKSGMYLENSYNYMIEAKEQGVDVKEFANTLAMASLKHWQVLESLRISSPEDAQPIINQINDYARLVNEKTTQLLNESGQTPPPNPFNN